MTTKVVCFGAAHVDIKAFSLTKIIFGQKNPVQTKISLGGVARNIAENLARLEVDVALVSRVGHDQWGDLVLESLKNHGIRDLISRSSTYRTGNYTALLQPDGNMAVAFADMEIYSELTIDQETLTNCLKDATLWILDANLSEKTICSIAKACPADIFLWGAGVSTSKNKKFIPVIHDFDFLMVNEEEYESLDIKPRNALVSQGEKGVSLIEEGKCTYFAAQPASIVDVTGAGDALMAGVIFGFLKTLNLKVAVPYGLMVAKMALETSDSVNRKLGPDIF